MDNFIVLVSNKHGDEYQWIGDRIDVTPELDASLGLVDIQVSVSAARAACSVAAMSRSNVQSTLRKALASFDQDM